MTLRLYSLLPNNFFGSHWGFTSFAEPYAGELGGYAHGAIRCMDPIGRVPSSSLPCSTNEVMVDTSAGSTSTSNDLSPERYPNAELYIMGCARAIYAFARVYSHACAHAFARAHTQADNSRRPSRIRRRARLLPDCQHGRYDLRGWSRL